MLLEPGLIEPLDQAAYERALLPVAFDALPAAPLDASGSLEALARGLDDDYAQIVGAATPPADEAEFEALAVVSADATRAVDQGTGNPDPAVVANLDGGVTAAATVHEDMIDAPDPEEAVSTIIPADYVALFDFNGTGVPFDQLTPEQQALVNNIPGGDLELLPEPGSGKGPKE